MATFAELCTDVQSVTNRPDLVAETKLAVRMATLKAHHSDFYPKDLHEHGLVWAAPAFQQSLDTSVTLDRYRALKYLRKYDTEAGKFFTVLTPEEVLDSYGVHREDVCYLAGSMIEIRSSTEDEHMLIGYYRHPDITESGYSSWIAVEHPFLIVVEAAATVFKQIGFDEQTAIYREMAKEQLSELRLSNVLATGE